MWKKHILQTHRVRLLSTILMISLTIAAAAHLYFKNSLSNVSAVETSNSLGIYFDENLTQRLDIIRWGEFTPGESKEVEVYIRNEGQEPFSLALTASNWSPIAASSYISFSWSCSKDRIQPGEIARVNQVLHVSSYVQTLSAFSFDIAYQATNTLMIKDFVSLFANNPNVKMIYPSDSTPKPLNLSAASVSDWTASAFVSTKLSNVTEGFDTDSSFVDQKSGNAIGSSGSGIVSFGGPCVNPVVAYAESPYTSPPDRAPIEYYGEAATSYFVYQNGSKVPGASLPVYVINNDRDMFLIEIYKDGSGRYIMLSYGFGWKGTYAAGKYFDTVIYPGLESHTESWIIVKWEDTNGNGFVNAPEDGDTYTVIAKGTW